MRLVDAIAWLLIVVPAIPFLAMVVLLYRRAWTSDSPSLRERLVIATRDWLAASAFGLVALNRILHWELDGSAVLLLLGTGAALVSLPSAYWLLLYFRGSFR